MQEINKFDTKISSIPNGIEKYAAFKNLLFIDSMKFMNSKSRWISSKFNRYGF